MIKPTILKGINPKHYFPNEKHVIVYSLSIGERHYFRFDDILNTPYDRALKTLVYYKELDMNCDRDFIDAHTKAFDNILSQSKINLDNLISLKQLNDQLKERIELPKEPMLLYKLASVIFFDQFENPKTYEFNYGEKKIKAWKKNTTLTDFFLQKPLRELIPYLEYAGENLEQYSAMVKRVTDTHTERISKSLSTEQRTIWSGKRNLSQAL